MAALPQLTLLRPINTTLHVVVHHHHQPAGTHEHVHDDDDAACCCRTPTSPESQLPSEAKVCPPAPRKPRRATLLPRRRRQLDLELVVEECSDLPELITVSTEELEATLTLTRRRGPGTDSCCGSATKGSSCRKRKRR